MFLLFNLFAAFLGVAVVVGFKKIKGKVPQLINIMNFVKAFAGAAIITLFLFRISTYRLLGTGIDMILSFIGGILLAAGVLGIETDLI